MPDPSGLTIAVRLTPNGGRDQIDTVEEGEGGTLSLRARVTAVPEDGKANKALIRLLSDVLRVPKSAIELTSGQTARNKNLRIDGDPEVLMSKLKSAAKR